MADIFYVYEHWRPDRGECFYVGKGKGRRANELRSNRNRFHKFIQAKLSRLGTAVEVRIIADGLSEEEAFALERERIALWRADGADLANWTDGGEGPSGYKQSAEHRRKNSEAGKAYLRTPEGSAARGRMLAAAIAANTGRSLSAETKIKMSKTRKGRPLTAEQLSFIQKAKNKSPAHIAAITAAKAKALAERRASEDQDVTIQRQERRRARRAERALARYHRLRRLMLNVRVSDCDAKTTVY